MEPTTKTTAHAWFVAYFSEAGAGSLVLFSDFDKITDVEQVNFFPKAIRGMNQWPDTAKVTVLNFQRLSDADFEFEKTDDNTMDIPVPEFDPKTHNGLKLVR